ncbi:group 1 glycosyl transferase [Candidatus Magnetobacterium bavaricum]|uniref:Group 1 glycosyl transferase n=1 Tax=Candidatus Magnetobacterium bavaricum TaxID=29290 RepID=A0A0F3GLY0_9BACT|nr:group 1 glycosyl transferase [Candidatus Magnetobacterium bavaricum]
MVIAIDGLYLLMARTGLGRYMESLVREILKAAPENKYYLYDGPLNNAIYRMQRLTDDPATLTRFTDLCRFVVPTLTAKRTLAALGGYLTGRSKRALDEVELFWGPGFKGVYKQQMTTVVTIHDMSHEYFPEALHSDLLAYLKRYIAEAVSNAHTLIAVSENTKMDIVKFLKADPSKIKVIYEGVSGEFRIIEDPDLLNTTKDRYNLPEDFIFALGTIQPRKNILGLLKAFATLCAKPSFKHCLVISGAYGWKSKDIYSSIATLGITDRVRFTGYVADMDLPCIYNLADVFVYPSLYEGFGLPVLEAMACGVPVVTSNVSSIPEVATGGDHQGTGQVRGGTIV